MQFNLFDGFLLQILAGAWITLQVACCALLLGLMIGILGAIGESLKIRWLRYCFIGLISIIRGLPELLVLFFIYFGSTIILSGLMHHYVDVSAFTASIIAMGLIFGAYASQAFRGAFLAIPYSQIEAAKALGFNHWQIFSRVTLPQAWRHALPALGNLWLVLLKDTALVALIGLADLMNKVQVAANTTHKPFTFYLLAAYIYLIMTSVSQKFIHIFSVKASKHLA